MYNAIRACVRAWHKKKDEAYCRWNMFRSAVILRSTPLQMAIYGQVDADDRIL
jgi:hypothetical protein